MTALEQGPRHDGRQECRPSLPGATAARRLALSFTFNHTPANLRACHRLAGTVIPEAMARFVFPLSVLLLALAFPAFAEPPAAAKQIPDLASLPDRTEDLRSRVAEGGGSLLIEEGVYRITGTIEIPLEQRRSVVVAPAGGPVTLIMDGAGPAIRIVGSHEGTAGPGTFQPATWNERMPLVEGIEIVGNHPEADGIELVRTVQATVSRVAVRWCRHGIRLAERNRNTVVSDVHLYENSGVGLYLDDVNLHQINVANSHISYNRAGGIVVRDGNVRNLHITGCDLITGNVISDTTINVDISVATDVTLSGNTFFAPSPDNLLVRDSKRVIVDGNTFNPRQFERPGRVIFRGSEDCIVSDCTFRALDTEGGTIVVDECTGIRLDGNVMTECRSGIVVRDSSHISIRDWLVSGLPEGAPLVTAEGAVDNLVDTGHAVR